MMMEIITQIKMEKEEVNHAQKTKAKLMVKIIYKTKKVKK